MARRNKKPKARPAKEPIDAPLTGREPFDPPRPRPFAFAMALSLFSGWLAVLAWLAWQSITS